MARPTPAAILEPLIDMPDPADLAVSNESLTSSPGRFALNVRMLFSALVDADFLDTEAYFDASSAQARSGAVTPAALQAALHAYLGQLGRSDTPVNRARAEVLAACREKAVLSPGVFSLTVPTGGGKTLSSLAFALDHAVQHGKRRVIYAIPFTSIIEQTADVRWAGCRYCAGASQQRRVRPTARDRAVSPCLRKLGCSHRRNDERATVRESVLAPYLALPQAPQPDR
jgi:CRISPR-associated endonuclease/helicase Cas3